MRYRFFISHMQASSYLFYCLALPLPMRYRFFISHMQASSYY
jgi:hypothetical protein